jgi:hypothetical protein
VFETAVIGNNPIGAASAGGLVITSSTPTVAAQFAFAHRCLASLSLDPSQHGFAIVECRSQFRSTLE